MTLKTLNDFDKEYGFVSGNFGQLMKDFNLKDNEACETMHCIAHFTGDLRQEAIKWIKHINTEAREMSRKEWTAKENRQPLEIMKYAGLDKELDAQVTWIKMFFNIKEEEMK
jgi:hypothetical protein